MSINSIDELKDEETGQTISTSISTDLSADLGNPPTGLPSDSHNPADIG